MEKIILKNKPSLPQIGWYDSQDRDIILFIDTVGLPHALLIRDPLSGESTMKANRARAKELSDELESEVEEKCVRITKQGFVGESGAHYILSFPDDEKEEDEDEGIEVFTVVGAPQFSRRKNAPAYEYDHSSWKAYCDAEEEALNHKDVKDCIAINHTGNIIGSQKTVVTLFEDGTLCSSNDNDLIFGYDESLSLGDKSAYNNSDIPEGARDKKFVSIHRLSDCDSPQCVIAITDEGEYFIIGKAPRLFKTVLDCGCSVIIIRGVAVGAYIECIGVKPDGRLAYVTSYPSEKEYARKFPRAARKLPHNSEEEYVEQMEDAEDIADITFHSSGMYDEDGDYIGFEVFAAVSLDNKISVFGADDYVKEYISMIPSEFQA